MITGFSMTHQLTDFSSWSWILGYHWQRSQQTAGVLWWRTWKWAFPNTANFPTGVSNTVKIHITCFSVQGFIPTTGSPTYVISSCLYGCQLYKTHSNVFLYSEPSKQKHQGKKHVYFIAAVNRKPTIDTFSTCLTSSTMMSLISAAVWKHAAHAPEFQSRNAPWDEPRVWQKK